VTEKRQEVEAVLRSYALYWPTPADCARAFDDFSSHHLSHGLGILDALIAETAVGCEAQLATFNKKHYRVVDALQMIQPYPRL
jgi:predicted nucleic acid-binding protein